MKKIIVCLSLLSWVFTVNGQSTTRQQADSLLKLMPDIKSTIAGVSSALKLADFYIMKQGSLKPDLDSAQAFINSAKGLTSHFKSPSSEGYINFEEGRLANEKGKNAEGRPLVAKAVKLLKATKDTILYGRACYELSRYYTNLEDAKQLAVRVSLVEQAVASLKRSPDQIDLGADMQMLGDLYLQQRNFIKSLEILRSTLELFKSIGHKELQGVYILMSSDEIFLGNYQQANAYGLLAITASEDVHESGMQRCQIENVVGSTYNRLLNFTKAIEHKNNALAIAIKFRDTSSIYYITNDLCTSYLNTYQPEKVISLLNRIRAQYPNNVIFFFQAVDHLFYLQAYLLLKNYKMATIYYNYARSLLNNPKLPDLYMDRVYIGLTRYEIAMNKFPAAYSNLKMYATYAEKYHNNSERKNSYGLHAQLDSLTQNFRSAYFYNIRYHKLADSLSNETKNKQIQELEVIYKFKEKDYSIVLLNQKAKLQDAALSKSKRATDETIAGVCVLLIGGGFFIRHYNLRQRTFRIIGKKNDVITAKSEEILIKNRELEGLIQEKEYLLIEIHHRVKNNLHTVLSFLSLQSKYLKGEALAAIKISRQRIYAMSLIHQKLYMAENIKTIDMKSYLEEFVSYFTDSFSPETKIKFSLDLESLRLQVNKAIPVGLIINEAITNSAKYAFPANKAPLITLSLRQIGEFIELVIKDNGIGIPGDVNQTNFDSLGIKLIKGLCNDLAGTVAFDCITGTTITVLFQP